MSRPSNNGGSAFPCEQGHTPEGTWNHPFDPRMSLRDYFAAKALQSLVLYRETSQSNTYAKSELAAEAYHYADEMIKARWRNE